MSQELKIEREIESLSGTKISTLKFDFDRLTPRDYRQIIRIEKRLKSIEGDKPDFELSFDSMYKKTSSEFRMATAWMAAVKGTDGLCLDDIDKLHLLDLLELEEIGSFFIAHVA